MGPRDRKRRAGEGFTMVEAALLVCLLGVALAVFVPGFFRELELRKTAEAVDELTRLSEAAAAYYATAHQDGGLHRLRCLPEAAGPTPEEAAEEPREVLFTDESVPGHATWAALGHDGPRRVRYRYRYEPSVSGCGLTEAENPFVVFRAEGDLDGDGQLSTFERRSAVRDGELVPVDALYVVDRVE